jgi:cell division protein FtsL
MKKEKQKSGLGISDMGIALIAMSIVLILAIIKIYISNRIYYESRKINKIESEVSALREENRLLGINVEKLEYKSRIEDTIFTVDDDEKGENGREGESF